MIKPAYNNIPTRSGLNDTAVCRIELAPLFWVGADIIPDYLTGIVTQAVNLGGKLPLDISFVPGTAKYAEKSKLSKAGDYYEISVACTGNNLSSDVRATLETLRGEKIICILTMENKSMRIIGNKDDGPRLQYSSENSVAEQLLMELSYSSKSPSPIYAPV